MKHNFQIIEGNLLLKPLQESDALLMRVLRNKMKHCFLTQNEISEEQQIAWYRNYLTKENDYMFAVSYADTANTFVGAVAVYDIDGGIAEVGRVIIDKEQFPEKGIGRKAVFATCRIGFDQLHLKKIYAKVLPDNVASLTTFRRLAFLEVGEKDGCIYFEMKKERFKLLYGSNA